MSKWERFDEKVHVELKATKIRLLACVILIARFPINSIQEMSKHISLLLLRKQLIVCKGTSSSLNENNFTSSMISPYFNIAPLHKIIIRVRIIACSETLFTINSYRIKIGEFSHNLSLEVQILWKVSAFKYYW